ncbi:ribonuclease T2 [Chelativorans sp. YIM 93263]|uniref:ribonuclease T2 n=1 Tax=Chelativorans sp. YIM 93263 TaxID=2906648 RepID=UPI0023786959|nr:ribonuclease T2 [Chelativorans sp. YIM 93263]
MRALVALAALLPFITSAMAGERGAEPGNFDFYVLSLSWSPSYCAAEGSDANPRQCGAQARPYAFIVHGLWPQYENSYPEFCPTHQPDRVPDRLVHEYLDIVPSAGLIGHQWRKHGSCSGLTQADYLALLRKAREVVEIPSPYMRLTDATRVAPENVETQFIDANPGLPEDGVTVTCDRRFLREVRICMTRDLEFRSCEEVDRNACRRSTALMPAVRSQ